MDCFSYKLQIFIQIRAYVDSIASDYFRARPTDKPTQRRIYSNNRKKFTSVGMAMYASDNQRMEIDHENDTDYLHSSIQLQDNNLTVIMRDRKAQIQKEVKIRLKPFIKEFKSIKKEIDACVTNWLNSDSPFKTLVSDKTILSCSVDKESEIGKKFVSWAQRMFASHITYLICSSNSLQNNALLTINNIDNDLFSISFSTLNNNRKKNIYLLLNLYNLN